MREHVHVDLADLRRAADESDDVVVVPAWLVLELLDERLQLRTALEHFADLSNWWDNGEWACNVSPVEVAQQALGPVIEQEAPPF